MYYLQSRYYNPEWGRFINADAFVSTGQGLLGNNMFAYCGNNPVDRTDPSGCSYASTQRHRISSEYTFAQDVCIGLGVGGAAAIGLALGSLVDDLIDEMLNKLKKVWSRLVGRNIEQSMRSTTLPQNKLIKQKKLRVF